MGVNKVSSNTDYKGPLVRWEEMGSRACAKDLIFVSMRAIFHYN